MLVYLINIFLIFLWAIPLLKTNPTDKKKKLYCGIVALQWTLISGLRHWSVGADTYAYYDRFEMVKTYSWDYVLSNCWNYLFGDAIIKDPGYDLVEKIFQIFSDNYQVFLLFIALLFTGLMARWIYKYSSMPEISFLIYSVLFYAFYAVTGHRQTIATALIFFVGYEFAKEKKIVKFAVVAFAAFMIHKSSIVFIIYYLIANINLSFVYIVIMTVSIGGVALLGKQLYAPIAYALGFDEGTIEYAGGGAETYATVLLLLCLVSFFLYQWINKRREDAKYLYNMMFLTTASSLLVYQQQSFMRIQQYFSLIIMIMVPEIILTIEKKYRVWAYLGVVGILVSYFLRNVPSYRFFFM